MASDEKLLLGDHHGGYEAVEDTPGPQQEAKFSDEDFAVAFEAFSQTTPFSSQPLRPATQQPASGVIGVPMHAELPDAARLINIPELRSASAEWHSTRIRCTFIALLVLSIWQLAAALPWTIIIVGVAPLGAAILGIVMASMYLCESCQTAMLEANVKVISMLGTVGAALDVAFVCLVCLALLPAANGTDDSHCDATCYLMWAAWFGSYLGHAALCGGVVWHAHVLKRLLHPVRAGMLVLG